MSSLVSVVVPSRGVPDPRTLASIKAQTYPNVELLVITVPGRSAAMNHGAAMAKGEYLYRCDDDYVPEPTVIEEAIDKCNKGFDAVVIHNSSDPTVSLWGKVRKVERDCYRDDPTLSFARFIRREAFDAVGGFNETLEAEEDRDFHDRLLAAGFKIGGIKAKEVHVGEPKHLYEIVRRNAFYGPHIRRYVGQRGTKSAFKLGPFKRAYVRHWREIAPIFPFFVFYQFVRYISALAGMIVESKPVPQLHPDIGAHSYGAVVPTRRLEDVKFTLPCPTVIIHGPMSLNEARNQGAMMFSTDLIAFVDDDNKLDPNALSEMAKAFRLDIKIGVVSPLIYDRDGKVWFAGGRFTRFGLFAINKRVPKGYRTTETFHNVFMVRRSAFEEAGGFDPKRFGFYMGESDLAERMKKIGYRFVVAPRSKVWHDISSEFTIKNIARTSHIRNKQRAYLVGKNKLVFFRLRKGLSMFFLHTIFLLAPLTLFHITGMVGTRRFDLIRPYLRGIVDGLNYEHREERQQYARDYYYARKEVVD